MTDIQKKKLIDLGFIIVGIILVGLFLKTQLSNPILINVDEKSEDKPYLVGSHHEDDEDLENSGVSDIKSISIAMDNAYIDVVIELREMPERLPLQNNTYNWSVFFDVDDDGTEIDDIVIEHKNEASTSELAAASDDAFTTLIKRLKTDEIEILGVGESAVEGKMLLLRIPNSNKLKINENTPYKIILTHQMDQITQRDEMPNGK
jgi:hypothetical protein